VTVGVLILIAAIVALLFLRRKRGKAAGGVENGSTAAANKGNKNRISASSTTPTMSEADGRPVSEVGGSAARPWSMRSELEGSQVKSDRLEHSGGHVSVKDSTYQVRQTKDKSDLSPVAELPANGSW